MDKAPNIDETEVSPFAQFLLDQREGETHKELSQFLADVSEAVLEHGGRGTIVLKIVVMPLGHEKRLVVKDEIKVTLPKRIKDSCIFFYDDRLRGLSRRDPRQGELNLGVIPIRPRTPAAVATDQTNSCAE